MQRYSRVWKSAAEAAFRPHVHREDCRICAAAASAQKDTKHVDSVALSCAIDLGDGAASAASGSCTSSHQDASSFLGNVTSSVFELRRAALLEWQKRFLEPERKEGVSGVESLFRGERPDVLNNSADFDAVYEAYLRCEDVTVQEALFSRLVDWVDAQCSQPVEQSSVTPTPTPAAVTTSTAAVEEQQWGGVRIPQCLVAPRVDATLAPMTPKVTAPLIGVETGNVHAANDFETYVRRRFSEHLPCITKQLNFQEALLAVQTVLNSQNIRFFLACGTALGARRDGCFIPYDEDIDLGILYTDIVAPLANGDALPMPDFSSHSAAQPGLSCAQLRVYRLLHALSLTRAFVVFDICGAVEKGLELRILHMATSTRIDINLYYPPLRTTTCSGNDDASDDSLVRELGAFVWASSFYEAADARKHHMYRYRHKPFATELEELSFCAKTTSLGSGFLVPPERYLVENYGEDWRTPKQYSYTEGLAGEFKNILKE
ncbi:putative LicD family [Leishmania utingensis]|uniref:LicD family n=1 Tax=Leishmania utingensis TaxID=653362 RepID=A0AAW3A2F3_9TRYP